MAANNGRRNEYEALASSVQGRFQQQSPLRAQLSLFRVPNVLQNGNDKVYVPELLSIGPLHRGLNLQTLERIKSWYLLCLLERNPTPNTGLHHFVKAIKDIEQNCRDCYEEQIDLSTIRPASGLHLHFSRRLVYVCNKSNCWHVCML
ncbi:hypothetical protein ACFX2C_028964 [Malus domestica]